MGKANKSKATGAAVVGAQPSGVMSLILELSKWLLMRPWSLAMLLSVALAVIVITRYIGKDILFWLPLLPPEQHGQSLSSIAGMKTDSQSQGNLAQCISKAIEKGRPYAVISATQLVRIDDADPGRTRKVTARGIYTLVPTRAIAENETVFQEFYDPSWLSWIATESEHWYGTEREILRGTTHYEVLFSAAKDSVYTVVTGGQLKYSLPFPLMRSLFGESVPMSQTEDAWLYPNKEDVICELLIVIESSTLNVRPVGRAAKRWSRNGLTQTDGVVRPSPPTIANVTSLSARWADVMPGEEVGIIFSW